MKPRSRVLSRVFIALAFAVLLGALAACTAKQAVYQAGVPGARISLTVGEVAIRGVYLDVKVGGGGVNLQVFAPADGICRAVLAPGKSVTYVELTLRGRFTAGDQSCDAVGIGAPQIQANRQPRARGKSPIPRSQATYVEIFRDDAVRMMRGTFPQTAAIGWLGGLDTIAVIPRTKDCDALGKSGSVSMEYRAAGKNRLTLVGKGGLCPVIGLIQPPSQLKGDSTESAEG